MPMKGAVTVRIRPARQRSGRWSATSPGSASSVPRRSRPNGSTVRAGRRSALTSAATSSATGSARSTGPTARSPPVSRGATSASPSTPTVRGSTTGGTVDRARRRHRGDRVLRTGAVPAVARLLGGRRVASTGHERAGHAADARTDQGRRRSKPAWSAAARRAPPQPLDGLPGSTSDVTLRRAPATAEFASPRRRDGRLVGRQLLGRTAACQRTSRRQPVPGDLSAGLITTSLWTDEMVAAAGIPIIDVPFVTFGGGIGSFVTVDYLRIRGVPPEAIKVLTPLKTPWESYEYLTRVSQIPRKERLRSDSASTPDNIWGFPSYAVREAFAAKSLKGFLAPLWQVVVEPIFADYYTPESRSGVRVDGARVQTNPLRPDDPGRPGANGPAAGGRRVLHHPDTARRVAPTRRDRLPQPVRPRRRRATPA